MTVREAIKASAGDLEVEEARDAPLSSAIGERPQPERGDFPDGRDPKAMKTLSCAWE